MTKPFDPTKPVQTRDGREVKLFLDYPGGRVGYPYLGVYKRGDEGWFLQDWAENGSVFCGDDLPYGIDLVNVPERRGGWINIEEAGQGVVYPHRNRIACIYVEFEEGEGLSND